MINVTLGEVKTQKPFPKLMKSIESGAIIEVLQEPNSNGYAPVVIRHLGDSAFILGYKDSFNVTCKMISGERFTDYNEPITIQNA